MAPVCLLAIGGVETACQNLMEIAQLTGRVDQAQRAIDRLRGVRVTFSPGIEGNPFSAIQGGSLF